MKRSAEENDLTEFERRRLENIQRNQAILKQLDIPLNPVRSNTAAQAAKRKKAPPKRRESVKTAPSEPSRRSSRLAGVKPEKLTSIVAELENIEPKKFRDGRISIDIEAKEALFSALSQAVFVNRIEEKVEITQLSQADEQLSAEFNRLQISNEDKEAIKVSKDRILSAVWHPSVDRLLVACGDKIGRLAILDVTRTLDNRKESTLESQFNSSEDDVVHTMVPHDGGITNMCFDSRDTSKLYTSSYDGSIRVLDVSTSSFEQVYLCSDRHSVASFDLKDSYMYIGKNYGELVFLDTRSKSTTSYEISTRKVSSVHINPANSSLVCTAGLDNHFKIWDRRHFSKPVSFFEHDKSVTSAYWNSAGDAIVSTSYDDTVQIFKLPAAKSDSLSADILIHHNNQTGNALLFRLIRD